MIHEYKVGETVIITQRGCRSRKRVGEVQEITKAGNIRVDGVLYNKTGQQKGQDILWGSRISPATAEELEEVRREEVIRKCRDRINSLTEKEGLLTYELAVKLMDALKDYRRGGKSNDT